MGQLRDRLDGIAVMLNAVYHRSTMVLPAKAHDKGQAIRECFDAEITTQVRQLYLYLEAKFRNDNDLYAHHLNDKLLSHKDARVVQFVASIAAGKARLLGLHADWEKTMAVEVNSIKGDFERLEQARLEAEKMLKAKESRWVQSQRFKDKLPGYKRVLQDLKVRIARWTAVTMTYHCPVSPVEIAAVNLSKDTTLGELDANSMLGDLKSRLAEMDRKLAQSEATGKALDKEAAQFVELIKMFNGWAIEAHQLEMTVLDTAEIKDPGKVELISLSVWLKSVKVAESKRGVYDRDRKELITDLVWDEDAGSPAKLLDKHMRIKAKHKDASEGGFENDMKLAGLMLNFKRARFQQ